MNDFERNPLDAVDRAEDFDSGYPPLLNGSYEIEITDCKFTGKGKYWVAEYKVTESCEGGSPVGTLDSCCEDTTSRVGPGYIRQFILMALGPEAMQHREQIGPYTGKIGFIAVTKVTRELAPGWTVGPKAEQGGLIGRRMRVSVTQGKEPAPGKKYYPTKKYAPVG